MTPEGQRTIRVLIVDDHQSILWGLVKLIENERPRMEVAATATTYAEAINAARRERPDVILLDIDLGGENSLGHVPELARDANAQVLILTGMEDQESHDRAMIYGARGVVLKKEPVEVILKAIEKVYQGEIWLDRAALGRVFTKFSHTDEAIPADPEADKIHTLTAKEREIIVTVLEENGLTNKLIAKQLNISEFTLRNHLSSIYSKLGVSSRLELFIYACKHNLAQPHVLSQ